MVVECPVPPNYSHISVGLGISKLQSSSLGAPSHSGPEVNPVSSRPPPSLRTPAPSLAALGRPASYAQHFPIPSSPQREGFYTDITNCGSETENKYI